MTATHSVVTPAAWSAALAQRRPPVFAPPEWSRVVVVAAHPDDETLGAGPALRALVAAGAEPAIVIATDGEAAQADTRAGAHAQRPRHPVRVPISMVRASRRLVGVGVVGPAGGHGGHRRPAWDLAGPSRAPGAGLPEDEPAQRTAGTVPVVVVRSGDDVHVLSDTCPHLAAPMSDGELTDGALVCPWHGSTFRLGDGAVVHGPATAPLPCFETRVVDGALEARVRTFLGAPAG